MRLLKSTVLYKRVGSKQNKRVYPKAQVAENEEGYQESLCCISYLFIDGVDDGESNWFQNYLKAWHTHDG